MTVQRLLAASFSVLLLSSVGFSCSCGGSGGCPGLGGKNYPVFLGTVLAVTDLPRTEDFAFLSSRKAHFHVDEPFGGLAPDVHEIDILTGLGGGDCGIPFKPGDVYLVAASLGKDGLFHTGLCSATRKIDFAEVALRVLRQRRDGQPVPSITGQIAQHDRNFEGLLGTNKPKPLANTMVRVKMDGTVYEARADAAGIYSFYDLPSGKYEFAPDLPPGTTLSWYIGSDKPLGSFDLILVNPDDSRKPDFPYPRTFYPGVRDRAAAGIISLRPGEQITGADIRIEQQFTPRHVTVRVVWADGRLIRDFVFVEAKGSLNPSAMSDTRQPDLKSSVIDLSILPNEPYDIEAKLTCSYADERSIGPGARLKSNTVHLEPDDGRTELFLTIPATACPDVPGKTTLTDRKSDQ